VQRVVDDVRISDVGPVLVIKARLPSVGGLIARVPVVSSCELGVGRSHPFF
jgi:hypothetical protein